MEDIDARRWCLLKNTRRKAMANHLWKLAKKTASAVARVPFGADDTN
jgi:hypothetical protein